MSGVFVVAPAMVAAPMVLTATAAVAASMGFLVVSEGLEGIVAQMQELLGQKSALVAEFDVDAKGLRALITEQGAMVLERPDATVVFRAGKGGRTQMLVRGKGTQSTAELEELGQEVLNKVQQQYAYHSVVSELKKRGFGKAEETVDDDGTIRLRLRRWD